MQTILRMTVIGLIATVGTMALRTDLPAAWSDALGEGPALATALEAPTHSPSFDPPPPPPFVIVAPYDSVAANQPPRTDLHPIGDIPEGDQVVDPVAVLEPSAPEPSALEPAVFEPPAPSAGPPPRPVPQKSPVESPDPSVRQATHQGGLTSLPGPVQLAAPRVAQAPQPPRRFDNALVRQDGGGARLTMNLRDEDLRGLLDYLSKEAKLNILASENVKGTVTATFTDVEIESALAAILQLTGYVSRREGSFVYVGTPADLLKMDQLRDSVKTRVYRTNYVTAAELQKLITSLLTEGVGLVTVSTPSKVDIPADTVTTGGDDFAGNEVVLVRDYEAVLAKVDDLVKEVDQRPRQVIIEAMILSVNLDDSHKFGINFELFKNDGQVRLVSGTPLSSLGQIDISNGGLNFGVLNSDVGGFVDALETIGDTNVIAAPKLLCLNKQRAEILIGDQKGFISTTQTETSTTQTVEFLDIGTQLRIRPFISDDGVIRLEVHPELSTGDVKLLGAFALPEKSVTQVTTNIMCRDGATVVIGGLIREDFSNSVSQIVGLGNIPILGGLLRNKFETVTRNEIVVLITPRIIHDPALMDDGKPAAPDVFGRQAAVEAGSISPIKRHHYSDRYYRLAYTAWVAGNAAEAIRYLDLSLQFKPNNRPARKLYGVVTSAMPERILIEDRPIESIPTPVPQPESNAAQQAARAAQARARVRDNPRTLPRAPSLNFPRRP